MFGTPTAHVNSSGGYGVAAGGNAVSASEKFAGDSSKKFESGSEAALREDSGESPPLKFNEELDYDGPRPDARGQQEAELARLEQARQNIEERLKE